MADYQRILTAVDLSDQSPAVVQKAADLALQWRAQLILLHVVEFVPIEPMSDALVPVMQVDDQVIQRARERIHALARTVGLDEQCCRVATGSVKTEVLRLARESQADLILLGTRERHGLSILVNLVEDTVLHGAPCDVLAVRVAKAR
jgi:universal stress protein A